MKLPGLRLDRVVSAGFEENTYVFGHEERNDCLVVDPGMEPEKIIARLDSHGLTPAAILITHGHGDHIAGNAALKQRWPECRLVVGAGDAAKLTDPVLNLSAFYGTPMVSPPADETLSDGQIFSAAGFDLEIREIPGHSVGHVMYLWRDNQPMIAFVGDIIFAGSVGRTDFPDGDFDQLATGIRQKIYTLPDDTILLSGHGPRTTVGAEKKTNPFVGE